MTNAQPDAAARARYLAAIEWESAQARGKRQAAEAAEVKSSWSRVVAKINGKPASKPDASGEPAKANPSGWAKAVAAVNKDRRAG